MASNLRVMVSNLIAMASNLIAMASNLRAMASTLLAIMALLQLSLPELVPDALLILEENVRPTQDVPRLLSRRLANVGGQPLKAHDRKDHLSSSKSSFYKCLHLYKFRFDSLGPRAGLDFSMVQN